MSFEEQLIDLVRENEFLYNRDSYDYRNLELKTQKWQEIGARLGVDGLKARQRWQSLKDRFMREYNRSRKALEKGEPTRIVWKYYKYLLFLKDYIKERISYVYEDEVEMPIEQLGEEDYDDTTADPVSTTISYEPEEVISPRENRTEDKPEESVLEKIYNRHKLEAERRKKIKEQVITDKIEKDLARLMANITKTTVQMEISPVRAFFNAMALQIEQANIPFPTWAILQQEIMQLVNSTISALNME